MRVSYTIAMLPPVAAGAAMVFMASRPPPPPPPPPAKGDCYLADAAGRLFVFEHDIDGPELCAARLEIVHLTRREPVRGAFNDIHIAIDDQMIGTSSSVAGPFTPLFDVFARQWIDDTAMPFIGFERQLDAASREKAGGSG